MGLYYADLSGGAKTVAAVSGVMDGDGWAGGWRITDTTAGTIFNAENPANTGAEDWLFSVTPNVFIIDTTTMQIVAAEIGTSPTQLDVPAELEAL